MNINQATADRLAALKRSVKVHAKTAPVSTVYDNWSNERIANWVNARMLKAGLVPIRHDADSGSIYFSVDNSMDKNKLRIADHKNVDRTSQSFAASTHDIHPTSKNWKIVCTEFIAACKLDVEEYANW